MEANRRQPPSRIGPIIWGTIAFVLVAALGVSFLLSRQALSDAKADAENRAEEYTNTALREALTPEMTAGDIVGADYRSLVTRVQEGILSDDRVVRVRIWKPNGDLIFSTDQRDAVADVLAEDDVRIEQAAADLPTSTVTESRVPTADGLGGSDERLLETFMPLHLEDELSTSGVAQIDHRYSQIEEGVNRVWRPTQLGLAIALGISAMLLGISVRGRREEEPARGRPATRRAAAPSAAETESTKLRRAEERAEAAERAAREAERKLAESERQLAVAEKRLGESENVGAAVSASVAKRVEELEVRLKAQAAELEQAQSEVQRVRSVLTRKEAELEQAGSEVQRLVSTLSKKEAELAAAREGLQGVEAVTARSKDAAATAAAQVAEADRRASEAEEATAAARQLAAELEQRALAAEARLAEAEGRAADAERTAVELEGRARAAEQAAAPATVPAGSDASELEARLQAAAAELEEARQQLQGKDGELTAMAKEVGRLTAETAAVGDRDEGGSRVAELEARVRELEDQRRSDVSELQRAHEMLANTQVELAEASRRLKASEAMAPGVPAVAEGAATAPIAVPSAQEAAGAQAPRRPKRRAARREAAEVVVEPPAEEVAPAAAEVEERPAAEEPAAKAAPAGEPTRAEPEEPREGAEEEEGLSLRERLTRAAAARHRTLGKPDGS